MEKYILIPYEKYQRLQLPRIEERAKEVDVSKPKRAIMDTVMLPPPGKREHKKKTKTEQNKKKPKTEQNKKPRDHTIHWISF